MIPSPRKAIVPTAIRIGADMLEFAVPETVGAIKGKKYIKAAVEDVG